MLGNLTSNALRFTAAGGRIKLLVERRDPDVHFEVTDTGPGIAANEIEAIFDRFYQAEAADRLAPGLSISCGIVDAHGGRIWGGGTLGEGSTFHFTCPTSPRSAAGQPRNASTYAMSVL